MFLIVTASVLMPATQAVSQGAGQSRPVNSGKLFVACKSLDRGRPIIAVDEVIPVRNEIAKWATLITERNAAVHAS